MAADRLLMSGRDGKQTSGFAACWTELVRITDKWLAGFVLAAATSLSA